jgi:hypothetical protein
MKATPDAPGYEVTVSKSKTKCGSLWTTHVKLIVSCESGFRERRGDLLVLDD